jgi:alanyl-tRNA synthetase
MRSDQIRSTFIDFFKDLGHVEIPSGPIVSEDETLLFTNAGMNQFKPFFLGDARPPHPRLTSTQTCVRTVDIDNIGHTDRHGTSFEMLGSFSFGDYFKPDIMRWALRLLVDGYGLDRNRLRFTVFHTDEESFELWRRLGVPTRHIQKLGLEDNFWSMGVRGPCGPNTEIFYNGTEIWNLVFMQLIRGDGGDTDILGPLPRRCVDTGLGLDRLAMILQGVGDIRDIDVNRPLQEKVLGLTGHDEPTVSHRIVTDHLRTSLLLIEQGVLPGNDRRRYVVRRLLRRAIRHLRLLGITEPVLGDLTGSEVIGVEEVSFERTLRVGSRILEAKLRTGERVLDSDVAFRLHDRHGFPIELTEEIARESGVEVDMAGFERLMRQHRALSQRG